MFGTQSYLDKSMTGIKTFDDGSGSIIQNGTATFNNITVATLTATNLSDCNLENCTADDPTIPQSIANKKYVDDNFVNRTNNLNQDINGVKTFLSGTRYNNGTNYTTFDQVATQLTIKPVSINGSIALYSTNSFGVQTQQLLINNIGITTTTVTSTNFLGENYNTNSQIIYFGPSITTGNIFIGSQITSGNINIGNSTAGSFKTNIRGSLFSTGQSTFQSYCPKTDTNPSVANDLVKLSYLQSNYCDLTTDQSIGGIKTFIGTIKSNNYDTNIATNAFNLGSSVTTGQITLGRNQILGGTIAIGTGLSDTIIYGTIRLQTTTIEDGRIFKSRVIDSSAPLSSQHKLFTNMGINGILTIGNLLSKNVVDGNTTFNNQLISNNLTAPSTSIAGINNIFTNLSSTGYGIINIGAQGDSGPLNSQNQINIKSKLNIVESYYGGNATKITSIQQAGNSCRFTNDGSTNGSFIFEINELGTYNPLVINKTTIDINADAIINGRLTMRNDKLVDELQTLAGTSHTLIFPLHQTTLFTNIANIVATLPQVTNDNQLGLRFSFINLGSITTTLTFTAQGTNKIIPVGQMTQFTSSAIINNTKTICNLVIVKLGGIYIWTEYTF